MTSRDIVARYDAIAEQLGMNPAFYEFVARVLASYGVQTDADIIDIGCGTGSLLFCLAQHGYKNLHGVDLSFRAIELAREKAPAAKLWQHDILSGPIEGRYDVAFSTEVIEHLVDPICGLRHMHSSLDRGGLLFLTFPNRLAYFPWYYLKPVIESLSGMPWIQRPLRWFALPYEMQSKQPVDHSYSPREVADFLRRERFRIVGTHGMWLWPMLRVPNWRWAETLVAVIERSCRPVIPKSAYYRLTFVCELG